MVRIRNLNTTSNISDPDHTPYVPSIPVKSKDWIPHFILCNRQQYGITKEFHEVCIILLVIFTHHYIILLSY